MNKGFTLIELLAVIVILAIIALIATPIILNIIEDSKKQSVISSANLYVDGLVKQIATKNLTNEFNPSSCTITNGNVTCDGTSLTYEVNGDKPTSGSITFNNGIVTGYTLAISGFTVTKSGNNVTIVKGESAVHIAYTLGQLVQYDPVNNASCTTGETCYKWRVITVGDTTSNTTITLQMDHNLVNTVAWAVYGDVDSTLWMSGQATGGPVTILQALETATEDWDDSLKLNYTYDTTEYDSNYGVLSCTNGTCMIEDNMVTTNLKARIITGEEVRLITLAAGAAPGSIADRWTPDDGYSYYFSQTDKIIGTVTSGTGSTALSWLVENTDAWNKSGATSNTYDNPNNGYWALSAHYDYADYIDCVGYVLEEYTQNDYSYGARPVITIPKSVLN